MKAILLSAGYGTRLGSLTKNHPKCLFEIKNKPIIQIWIEKLYDVGVRDILINTHYLHNQVKMFIETLEYLLFFEDLIIISGFESLKISFISWRLSDADFIINL